MKFQVAYSRKVRTDQPYEMMSLSASVDGDTAVETMDQVFERVRNFVEEKIVESKYLLVQGETR